MISISYYSKWHSIFSCFTLCLNNFFESILIHALLNVKSTALSLSATPSKQGEIHLRTSPPRLSSEPWSDKMAFLCRMCSALRSARLPVLCVLARGRLRRHPRGDGKEGEERRRWKGRTSFFFFFFFVVVVVPCFPFFLYSILYLRTIANTFKIKIK